MADETNDTKAPEESKTTATESASPAEQVTTPTAAPVAADQGKANKSSKGINAKFVLIVVVVLALIGGGLYWKDQNEKKKAEKTAESLIEGLTGSKVDIDSDSQSIKYEDEDSGESVSIQSSQKLPSDFPKDDIPYLDEKSVTAVITSTTDGKKNWSVTTAVKESVDEAGAYFEDKLVEPDYTEISSYGYNESKTFSAKTVKYSIFITISKYDTDADTSVTYVIEEQ